MQGEGRDRCEFRVSACAWYRVACAFEEKLSETKHLYKKKTGVVDSRRKPVMVSEYLKSSEVAMTREAFSASRSRAPFLCDNFCSYQKTIVSLVTCLFFPRAYILRCINVSGTHSGHLGEEQSSFQ